MNIRNISYILIAIVITMSSCQKELTDINVNPNNLESPDITTLTRNIMVSEFWNNTDQAWLYGNGMSQLMVYSQSYYNQLYGTRFLPINNASYWSTNYANARDAATVVTQSKKAKNIGNQAVGLALESYAFLQLTELWGDIPYLQALEGYSGTYLAPYDNQQTVYTASVNGILARLKTADSLLAASPSVVAGDVLYGGSAVSWRKFINSLRLRTLLRISAKQDVSTQMQAIVTDGTIFQKASESATLALPNANPWYFPSYGDRAGDFSPKFMGSLLYQFYVNTQDQDRLKLLWAPSVTGAANSTFSFSNYGGMPLVADATTAQVNSASNFVSTLSSTNTTYTVKNVTNARIITYAEVQFILAEAALKGYVPGGAAQAATYYTNGILGAYAEFGLPTADATVYAAANPLDSDPATALNQIIMQKWALNLNNGYEGWIEQRRTGIPTFDVGANSQNGGLVPNKFLYPSDEEFINATNYLKEVQTYPSGKDDANYRAWW